jgi:general stress protein 26
MNKIEGIEEAFSRAKVIFLTTFDGDRENSRQMTNFNESPYKTMWFPTESGTRKVRDIEKNPRVLLTFPAGKEGDYYEVEGEASFADRETVRDRWRCLYWRPSQKRRFWFNPLHTENRVIINVRPIQAKLVTRS